MHARVNLERSRNNCYLNLDDSSPQGYTGSQLTYSEELEEIALARADYICDNLDRLKTEERAHSQPDSGNDTALHAQNFINQLNYNYSETGENLAFSGLNNETQNYGDDRSYGSAEQIANYTVSGTGYEITTDTETISYENINPDEAGWLNHSGHRQNMLRCNINAEGLGIRNRDGCSVYVQLLAVQ